MGRKARASIERGLDDKGTLQGSCEKIFCHNIFFAMKFFAPVGCNSCY